jgi:hypothetical protein
MTRRPARFGLRTGLLVALLAPLLALTTPTPALAATECRDETITNQTIRGNLVVPAGASCGLGEGTTVTGNVTVEADAHLGVSDAFIGGNVNVGAGATLHSFGSTIDGNVRGEGFSGVILGSSLNFDERAVVNGNVTLTGGTGEVEFYHLRVDGRVAIRDSTLHYVRIFNTQVIRGLTVEGNNLAGSMDITANTIGGSLQFTNNVNEVSSPSITGNTIRGSLSCEGNDPAPVVLNNTVDGRTTGQCADAEAVP